MPKIMKNLTPVVLVAIFVFILILPIFSLVGVAKAQDLGINYAQNLGLTDASNTDPRDAIVNVVKYLMTFLGIIAVVVILLGGFRWMTAAGNEDRVAEAKKLIVSGVIGLIIILAAFAIVTFVLNTTTNLLNG